MYFNESDKQTSFAETFQDYFSSSFAEKHIHAFVVGRIQILMLLTSQNRINSKISVRDFIVQRFTNRRDYGRYAEKTLGERKP